MSETIVTLKENPRLGEKYYRIQHSSGLDIYVIPKDFATYYALFGTRYGSIDNKFRIKGEDEFTVVPDGIAHFLEHKMFENENGEDTFARFARTGASANAFTTFDKTAYLFSCTENFDESLEILLDYVTAPYFTPENVEKEQGIIAQEIRMGEDNPGRVLTFDLLRSLYEKHNVRLEIAGTVESIEKITADTLYKCYNAFYNLQNMALCICGPVTVEQVQAVADRILHPQPDLEVESVHAQEEAAVYRARFSRQMQISKPLYNIGIKDIEISPDPVQRCRKSVAMDIICDILFGRTGDLYNSLYREGIINSMGYWFEHNKSYSFISVSGETGDPDLVYDRLMAAVRKKMDIGFSREDVERIRRTMYANYLRSFEGTAGIARSMMNFLFDDCDLLDFGDILSSVTMEEIDEVFRSLFREGHFALTAIYPLEDGRCDNNQEG